jgi:hypothetical protein
MVGILLAIGVFGLVMLAMSVGIIFNDRCLRGSCGGPDVLGPDGELLLCAGCPKRKERDAPSGSGLVAMGLNDNS